MEISFREVAKYSRRLYGAVSLMVRIHMYKSQEIEVGVVLLTITSSDPIAKFLFPVPTILHSVGLEDLVRREECFHQKA